MKKRLITEARSTQSFEEKSFSASWRETLFISLYYFWLNLQFRSLTSYVSFFVLPFMTTFISIITKLYEIIAISGLYILLGFLMAGVLHVTLSEALFRRVFGREGVLPLFRAIGLGSLIPICSCGVVPIGIGAYQSGAGAGTVLAFMTAAPALSPASALLAIKLLGWELAGWQIGTVIVGSFLLGLIANRFFRSYQLNKAKFQPLSQEENELVSLELTPKKTEKSCCSTNETSVPANNIVPLSCCSTKTPTPPVNTEDDCCSGANPSGGSKPARGVFGTIREIFHWIVFDFGPSVSLDMLIGLIFAASVLTLVPENRIVMLTGSRTVWSLLLVIVVALPVYTCSMAAIPVVFSFLAAGMSPGAAIAFLISGPATNFGEMNAIRNQMNWKIALYYFVVLLSLAIIAGMLVDHFMQIAPLQENNFGHHHRHGKANYTWLQMASTALLFFMMAIGAKRKISHWLK